MLVPSLLKLALTIFATILAPTIIPENVLAFAITLLKLPATVSTLLDNPTTFKLADFAADPIFEKATCDTLEFDSIFLDISFVYVTTFSVVLVNLSVI